MSKSVFDLTAASHPVKEGSLSNIWTMSNLYLRRNLSLFPFVNKMQETDFQELELILTKTLPQINSQIFHRAILPGSMNMSAEGALLEYYFSLSSLRKPTKETFYFESADRKTLTHVNNEDHLVIQHLQKHPFKPYEIKELLDLSMHLAEKVPIAVSEKYGYLTPNTNFCGTALIVEAYLHVPFLLKSQPYDKVREMLGPLVEVVGLNGKDGFVGDFAIIRNRVCLGIDEEALLKKVQDKALKLVEQEQKMRRNEALYHHWYHEVAKAYGALKHGNLFSVLEAFDFLSLLKVGVDLKWVAGVTDSDLNELLLRLRRGHIQNEKGKTLSPDELGNERAKLIQDKLASVTLKKL